MSRSQDFPVRTSPIESYPEIFRGRRALAPPADVLKTRIIAANIRMI